MACDSATLERLRHTAKTGKGPTAVWARKRLIEIDPEWAKANLNLTDPAPAVPVIPAAVPVKSNYQAADSLDAFAHTLTTALTDKWADYTEMPFNELEEAIKLILRDCEASDIPS